MSIEGDNLEFLQKFGRLSDRKYQSQIQKYLNYLIANQDLFQQTISRISSMVAIEQVELDAEQEKNERKRDRQLHGDDYLEFAFRLRIWRADISYPVAGKENIPQVVVAAKKNIAR